MCRPVCLPTWFTRLVNYIRASTTQKARQHNSNDSDAHAGRECNEQPHSLRSLPPPWRMQYRFFCLRRALCPVLFSPVLGLSVSCRPPSPSLSLPSRCTRFYALSLTPPPKGKRGGKGEGGGGGAKWEGHYPSRQFECILYCPFYAGALPPSLSLSLAREHE